MTNYQKTLRLLIRITNAILEILIAESKSESGREIKS